MWLMTRRGFYSVVRAQQAGWVQVRARDDEDLRRLLPALRRKYKVVETPGADYPFRVVVRHADWVRAATTLARDAARYPNFKDAVAESDPARADVYARVWYELQSIELLTVGRRW